MEKEITKFTIKNDSTGYKPLFYFYYDEITITNHSFDYILKQDVGIPFSDYRMITKNGETEFIPISTFPNKNLHYEIDWLPYEEEYKKICDELIETINDEEIKGVWCTDVGTFEFDIYYHDGTNEKTEFTLPNEFFGKFFYDLKLFIDKFFFNVPEMLDLGFYDYPTIEDNPEKKYYFPEFGDEHTLQDYLESTKDKYKKYKQNIKGYLKEKEFDDDVIDVEVDNFNDVLLDTYLNKYEFHKLMERLEYCCTIGMRSKER